jgi:hypothetical protein
MIKIPIVLFIAAITVTQMNVAQEKKDSLSSSDTLKVHQKGKKKPNWKPRPIKNQPVSKRDSVNVEIYKPLLRQKDDSTKK